MHWQELEKGTKDYGGSRDGRTYDPAYEKALKSLRWSPSLKYISENIEVFDEFLKAWRSLRGGKLDKARLHTIWSKEVEPYAVALEGQSLERLEINRVVGVDAKECIRVGMAIEHMYAALLTVTGVGQTNASKLLHLRLPDLIVMTDAKIRRDFFKLPGNLFSPHGYAFHFLNLMKGDILEARNELATQKKITTKKAEEYLRSLHGRRRSLAKLVDEYYYSCR